MRRHIKWCPNGCGKTVYYIHSYSERGYHCNKCGKVANDLEEYIKIMEEKVR